MEYFSSIKPKCCNLITSFLLYFILFSFWINRWCFYYHFVSVFYIKVWNFRGGQIKLDQVGCYWKWWPKILTLVSLPILRFKFGQQIKTKQKSPSRWQLIILAWLISYFWQNLNSQKKIFKLPKYENFPKLNCKVAIPDSYAISNDSKNRSKI